MKKIKIIAALFVSAALTYFQARNVLPLEISSWDDFVRATWQWDANWYDCIARIGYKVTYPAVIDNCEVNNAVFAPLFPFLGSLVKWLTDIPMKDSLVAVSLFMSTGFWFLLVMVLDCLRANLLLQVSTVLFLFWYPTSFFLIIPYTESTFLFFSLACVITLTLHSKKAGGVFGFLSGTFLSLSRFNGIALLASIVPSLFIFRRRSRGALIAIGVGTSLGFILFFGYLQIHFGSWKILFHLQKQGFGMNSDLGVTFDFFKNYNSITSLQLPGPNDYFTHDRSLGYFSLILSLVVSGLGLVIVKRSISERIFWISAPYAVASLIMSIYASSGVGFRSLSRYSFPVVVMSTIALIACVESSRFRTILALLLILISLFFVRYHLSMIHLFSTGNWVA